MKINVYINCCLWEMLYFEVCLLARYLQSHLIICSNMQILHLSRNCQLNQAIHPPPHHHHCHNGHRGSVLCFLSHNVLMLDKFSQKISHYLLMFAQISNKLGFYYVHIIWLILFFAGWCHFWWTLEASSNLQDYFWRMTGRFGPSFGTALLAENQSWDWPLNAKLII